MERPERGHPLGLHRVLDTKPCLPQNAEVLDNTLPIFSNEVLIRVERINIDAASFIQMESELGGSEQKIAELVLMNTRGSGKQHNRLTGSGGMLVGTVEEIGSKYKGPVKFKLGERVATMVSLTLTPLHLDRVIKVNKNTHQMEVSGHAILFEGAMAAPLPKDLPEPVAMAVFDVAGAPATVDIVCKLNSTLVVIGAGGKAGILSCLAGRRKVGRKGKVIGIESNTEAASQLQELSLCNAVLEVDASDLVGVQAGVADVTRGKMGDVVINVSSGINTEISTILAAKPKAKVIFFSMATSFSKVTLGAEGLLSEATLLFGNGYVPGHGKFVLNLLKRTPAVRKLFLQRYS